MTSSYLQSGDYPTFGLPTSTTAAQVTQASAMVDMYLKRPEGLIWSPDVNGNPCYMAAATPSLTITAGASIPAGGNVSVPVTGPVAMLTIGDVLILDRADEDLVEAVTVNALTPASNGNPATIGLRNVVNAHAPGALLEGGMIILDQRFMPDGRPMTMLSRTPVVIFLSGSGRYGYARRSDGGASNIDDFNLLASLTQFGGPPAWEIFDPTSTDMDPKSGSIWIPAGVMLAYYTEVRLRYIAGFTTATLPSEIKLATSMIIQAMTAAPQLGSVRTYRAGDTMIQRFADTMLSGDVKNMLNPYRASQVR
jgi:hypothetical protein